MIQLLHDNFVVILLVLFLGVLFWAFKPRRRKKPPSETTDTKF